MTRLFTAGPLWRLGTIALVFSALVATTTVTGQAEPLTQGTTVQTVRLGHTFNPTHVAVSPDSNWVWVADATSGVVEVVDARTRTRTNRYVQLESTTANIDVRSISVSPTDGWVAYVALSGNILRVDMHNLTSTEVKGGFSVMGAVAGVDDTLVVAGLDTGTEIIDLASGSATPVPAVPGPLSGVTLSSDGRTAYVRRIAGSTLWAVDIRSRTAVASHPVPQANDGSGARTAVSMSGQHLFASGAQGTAVSVDVTTGASTPAPASIGRAGDVSASARDGAYYVAVGSDLVLVDGATVIDRIPTPAATVHNPVYATGTNTLFAAGGGVLIAVLNPQTTTRSPFGS